MTIITDPKASIDITKEDVPEGHERDIEHGVPLLIGQEVKDKVVMTKYISTDNDHADWQPDVSKGTREQVTADVGGRGKAAKITILGEDGKARSLTINDGCYVWLSGTMTRIVGILPGRPPMNDEECEAYTEFENKPVPRFQQWDYRIESVYLTNGPEGRFNLNRTEEQKRLKAQTEMIDQQRDMMAAFAQMFKAGGMNLPPGSSADEVLKAGVQALTDKKSA